ncbi:MAG TPA: hypothetical protein VN797_04115 [Gemmatimonadaceae bacterium]|nr:hypothetical protein [Gemmatimonadaceae bacterium]
MSIIIGPTSVARDGSLITPGVIANGPIGPGSTGPGAIGAAPADPGDVGGAGGCADADPAIAVAAAKATVIYKF